MKISSQGSILSVHFSSQDSMEAGAKTRQILSFFLKLLWCWMV